MGSGYGTSGLIAGCSWRAASTSVEFGAQRGGRRVADPGDPVGEGTAPPQQFLPDAEARSPGWASKAMSGRYLANVAYAAARSPVCQARPDLAQDLGVGEPGHRADRAAAQLEVAGRAAEAAEYLGAWRAGEQRRDLRRGGRVLELHDDPSAPPAGTRRGRSPGCSTPVAAGFVLHDQRQTRRRSATPAKKPGSASRRPQQRRRRHHDRVRRRTPRPAAPARRWCAGRCSTRRPRPGSRPPPSPPRRMTAARSPVSRADASPMTPRTVRPSAPQ